MHPISDVVNRVVEVVDVDGVVRRIDVDDVVRRIDVNDVVSRIDWDGVLAGIDWDRQLARIDVDAVMRRIDTSSIFARSSAGVFGTFLDSVRTQLVLLDLNLWIVTRCRFWRESHRMRCYLPPRPGPHRQRHDRRLYPRGRANKAVEVQGRYCGFASKAVAIMADIFTVTFSFAVMIRAIEWGLVLFVGESKDEASNATDSFRDEWKMTMLFLYGCHWFAYFFLTVGLAGQTLGMVLVGLKVCNCDRRSSSDITGPHDYYSTVSLGQAFLRTCLLPVTLTLFPPLCVVGLWRRDGRMVHDLVARTGVVYLWDARLARLRTRAMLDRATLPTGSGDDDDRDPLDLMMDSEGRDGEDEDDQERLGFLREAGVLQGPDQASKAYDTFETPTNAPRLTLN